MTPEEGTKAALERMAKREQVRKAVCSISNHLKDPPDAMLAGMEYNMVPRAALVTTKEILEQYLQIAPPKRPAVTVSCEVTGLDEAMEKAERLRRELEMAAATLERMAALPTPGGRTET